MRAMNGRASGHVGEASRSKTKRPCFGPHGSRRGGTALICVSGIHRIVQRYRNGGVADNKHLPLPAAQRQRSRSEGLHSSAAVQVWTLHVA